MIPLQVFLFVVVIVYPLTKVQSTHGKRTACVKINQENKTTKTITKYENTNRKTEDKQCRGIHGAGEVSQSVLQCRWATSAVYRLGNFLN